MVRKQGKVAANFVRHGRDHIHRDADAVGFKKDSTAQYLERQGIKGGKIENRLPAMSLADLLDKQAALEERIAVLIRERDEARAERDEANEERSNLRAAVCIAEQKLRQIESLLDG